MQPPADPSPSVVLDWPIDDVACLTLARGAAFNTLTLEMVRALDDAVEEAHRRGARVLIVTGQGRAFCAGAHIDYFTEPNTPLGSALAIREDYVRPILRVFRKLHTKPFVSIAAINGFALGGGCELAMMCDFILAADTAKFGQPEIKLGVMPGMGGSQRLTRLVGRAKAMEMCLTGRMMDAVEAERAGLVARVVPAADLMADAIKTAETIAGMSLPIAMMTKETVARAEEMSLAEGLRFERRVFHAMFATEDQKEGMRAFVEKRKPAFKHR